MIVDSSAIVAILFNEPDAAVFAAAIAEAKSCRIFKGDDFGKTDVEATIRHA